MKMCPKCGYTGIRTERRPDGNSRCESCKFEAKTKHFDTGHLNPVPNPTSENIESVIRKEMPNPATKDLFDKEFDAIWSVIKDWDVNVPEYYAGYCGANGSHVMLILNKLRELKEL